jgi:hypothetical protein
MGKLVAFKRIAKAPLPPPPPPVVKLPSQAELDKMTPVEAYHAGEKLGEALLAKSKAESTIPAGTTMVVVGPTTGKQPKPVPPATTPTDPKVGMILYKESDTGIGFKRWAVWLEWTNRWTVWTEWGHENKHQARKSMAFMSETRAKAYMQSCIAAKLKRGYRRTK